MVVNCLKEKVLCFTIGFSFSAVGLMEIFKIGDDNPCSIVLNNRLIKTGADGYNRLEKFVIFKNELLQ